MVDASGSIEVELGPEPATHNPALRLLYQGVSKLQSSEGWRRALAMRRAFHRYSFHNTALIFLQRPDARLVAGYRKWQALGRQVRRGEKGILILAPIVKRIRVEESTEVKRVLAGFRTAHVFDVAQTEGEPLPETPRPVLLVGQGSGIGSAVSAVTSFAEARGLRVRYGSVPGEAFGSFTVPARVITIRKGLPPLQALKTLVHELAHGLMHANGRFPEAERGRLELEAESCAFLVLHELDLDTSGYSFPYLAGWADDPRELLTAGERAAKTADTILDALKVSLDRRQAPAGEQPVATP